MKKLLSVFLAFAMVLPMLWIPTVAETAASSAETVVSPTEDHSVLPTYTGYGERYFTDTYNDCLLLTVKHAEKTDFDNYLNLLEEQGYTAVVASHKMLGTTSNVAAMYQNGEYLINALWVPKSIMIENTVDTDKDGFGDLDSKGEMIGDYISEVKITIEPLRGTDLSVFDPASATAGGESLLIQVGVDGVGAVGNKVAGETDTNSIGGMSYLYRLSDGSFMVYDGGGKSPDGTDAQDAMMAARLYDTMVKYNTRTDGKIVIAGWYITHPHTDHAGAFMAFTKALVLNPAHDVSLERVICYLPNVAEQSQPVAEGTTQSFGENKIAVYNARLEELRANGTYIHKAHVGQIYYIRNLKVEILFTYDLLSPSLSKAFFANDGFGNYVETVCNRDELRVKVEVGSEQDTLYQNFEAARATNSLKSTTNKDGTINYTCGEYEIKNVKKNSALYHWINTYNNVPEGATNYGRKRYVDKEDTTKAYYRVYYGLDFTNTFSVVSQATLKVSDTKSYKMLWTGDQTSYGTMTVNKMYGAAMKSDFVQVMHHGGIQMSRGSTGDAYHMYYLEIQVNHFFGAVSGAENTQYTTNTYDSYYNADGSYGYVRAKYILWPGHLSKVADFIDGEPGDDKTKDDSRLSPWEPRNHLEEEAQIAGGNVYPARNFLTVFTLGSTVSVATDKDVITANNALPTKQAISSADDLADMSSDGEYYLTKDITVTDPTTRIGPSSFSGILDGNGHTIKVQYTTTDGATTFDSAQNGFLFYELSGTVKNLTIDGARVKVTGKISGQYGILARRAIGDLVVDNVHIVNSTITESLDSGNANVGGFFGDANGISLTIQNSSFNGTVTAKASHPTGGFMGRAGGGTGSVSIENCTVKGAVSGGYTGGFIGTITTTGEVVLSDCANYATYSASANYTANAFVGNGTATIDATCYDFSNILVNFEVKYGAGMRVAKGENALARGGIRYDISLGENGKDLLDSYKAAGYSITLGSLMVRSDKLGNLGLTEITKEALQAAGISFSDAQASYEDMLAAGKFRKDTQMADGDDGWYYTAAIYNFSSEQYDVDLNCVGYIVLTKGEETITIYASHEQVDGVYGNTRSLQQVASKALDAHLAGTYSYADYLDVLYAYSGREAERENVGDQLHNASTFLSNEE